MFIKILSILSIFICILKNEVEGGLVNVISDHRLNQNQTAKLIRSYNKSYGINQLSTCKVQLDNGDIIDLTSLDNSTNPRLIILRIFNSKTFNLGIVFK